MASNAAMYDRPSPLPRRATSIFSRRSGASSRALPSIAQAAARETKAVFEEQQRWIRARTLSRRKTGQTGISKSSKKAQGTVLIAVPQAKSFKLTPLEEEMATGPNAEILSAISYNSSESVLSAPSRKGRVSVVKKNSSENTTLLASSVRHATTTTKTSAITPIGTWHDGVFHWDESLNGAEAISDEPSIIASVEQPTISQTAETTSKPVARPSLTVVIPAHEPLTIDAAIANFIASDSKPAEPPPIPPRASATSRGLNSSKHALVSPIRLFAINEEDDLPSETAVLVPDLTQEDHQRGSQVTVIAMGSSSTSLTESTISFTDELSNTSSRSSTSSIASDDAADEKLLEDASEGLTTPQGATFPEDVHHTFSGQSSEKIPHFDQPLPPSPGDSCTMPPSNIALEYSTTHPGEDSDIRRWGTSRLHETRCRSPVLPSSVKRAVTTGPQNDFGLPSQRLRKRAVRNDNLKSGASTESGNHADEPTFELWAGPVPDEYAAPKAAQVGLRLLLETLLHGQASPQSQPSSPVPALPRRSRKRDWQGRGHVRNSKSCPDVLERRQSESNRLIALGRNASTGLAKGQLHRCVSESRLPKTRTSLLKADTCLSGWSQQPLQAHPAKQIVIDDGLIVVETPEDAPAALKVTYSGTTKAAASRRLVLGVLGALPTLQDLFNFALINKDMYSLYKAHELELLHRVCYNESPAAWEFGEWAGSASHDSVTATEEGSDAPAITAQSYLKTHRNNVTVIEILKTLVLKECRGLIRNETACALTDAGHPTSRRLNDAFWRIWSFCRIFGGEKGREDDMVGQLDWLRGGPLAHNDCCVATVNANADFDVSSVLLNPPDYFAKGNKGGLTETDLFEMMELWTCLAWLLRGYVGRVQEARAAGVYDLCGPIHGDEGLEGHVLMEWICYILTLGPAAVLDMAAYAKDRPSEGFAYADAMGWTKWNPLGHGGSRDSFLVDAVSRIHSERLAAAPKSSTKYTKLQRVNSRKVLSMLEEQQWILPSNNTSEPFSSAGSNGYDAKAKTFEVPISKFAKPEHGIDRHDSVCGSHSTQSSGRLTPPASPSWFSPAGKPKKSVSFENEHVKTVAPVNSRTTWGSQYMSPIQEHGSELSIASPARYFGGVAEDTSELAIRAVVELGFTAYEARDALRLTDMGDGLRVDLAVDFLTHHRRG